MKGKIFISLWVLIFVLSLSMFSGKQNVLAQNITIDTFSTDMLSTFTSTDPDQFFGKNLTGVNMDTDPPGLWRVIDGELDPPQGSYLDGIYSPMFEQIIDHRILRDVRISVTFFTGSGWPTHPGILFRGTDADNFGWLYIRPHNNGSSTAVVLSSAISGFYGRYFGGPHVEGLAGVVTDVGFNREVELVLEIVDDILSVDINGERRISNYNISSLGYSPEGMSGVAISDNQDAFTSFLSFSVTSLDVIQVPVDIKPGSYPNSINLKSKGKVPVAILTTDDFDAYDVDPDTCVFANANPLRWSMEDVDNDGDYDMLFNFKTQELDFTEDSTEATLEGKTYDEIQITGTDSVNIVPKGNVHSKKAKKKKKK